MAMQTAGMATISGSMLVVYVWVLGRCTLPGGSLANGAPASLVVAKIMQPEVEVFSTAQIEINKELFDDANVFQAVCRGASDGLMLAQNVLAMLIAFAAFANYLIGFAPEFAGAGLSLERMLGWLFYPFAFLIGVDSVDIS